MPPKDKKPEKPKGWEFDATESIILLFIALGILSTLGPSLLRIVTGGEVSIYGLSLSPVFDFFKTHAQLLKIIGYVVGGISALGTFVFTKKGDALWLAEKATLYPADMPKTLTMADAVPVQNPLVGKWAKIVEKAESQNPSEWRIAIIEADIILDDLLTNLRLPGDTMGEKLKAVEKSDFTTLDYAWEAHKARNQIAHDSDFLLNQRETRRIITLYEAVFKEFCLI